MSFTDAANLRSDAYTSRKRYTRRPLFIALFLITCLLSIDIEPVDAARYAYVTGKILDSTTGVPLKDASVCTVPTSQIAFSDAAGIYRIKVIQGHSYRVYYLKNGYSLGSAETSTVSNAGKILDYTLNAINTQFSFYPPHPAYPISPKLDDPPVHTLLPGKIEIAGRISVSSRGYKMNPAPSGAWEWDLHYTGAVQECEASYALSGVKISTIPATSIAFSDNFGIYRLQGLDPGTKYRIRAEKSGYMLKSVCDREYSFSGPRLFINELIMDSVSGNPGVRIIYGEIPEGKKISGLYKNYAVVAFPPAGEFGEVFFTINDERAIYEGNSYKPYARYYSNPIFIDANSLIRMVSWNWGSVRTPVLSRSMRITRGQLSGAPCFIVLCAEIEDYGENASSSYKWVNNELPCPYPYNGPDTRVSISAANVSGSKLTWSKAKYTKISMNTCNPYWDHRADYSPKEGFRFKISCEDIDKYGNPQRTEIQNLGSTEYRITSADIDRGYISLSFGAVKRLIILLNDTSTKK